MTYKEIAEMIDSIGIPCAYYQFPDGTDMACPFICFYFDYDNDFIAENINYQPIRTLIVELYTDNKDFALEQTVEDTLNANGLVYSRGETYIDSERMNMVTYTTEILITKENDNAEQG